MTPEQRDRLKELCKEASSLLGELSENVVVLEKEASDTFSNSRFYVDLDELRGIATKC